MEQCLNHTTEATPTEENIDVSMLAKPITQQVKPRQFSELLC